MRLVELEPEFVIYESGGITDPRGISFERAQGIWFLCPQCFAQNNGAVGTHFIDVSFEGRGVLPEQGSHGDDGKPTRWNLSGTGMDNLTLTPSILLKGGCAWHGHVTNGEITP